MKPRLAPRALFWVIVALAPVLAWYASRAHSTPERTGGPRPPPPLLEIVPVLTGARSLADGTEVAVELTRLHAEAGEQAFDAQALARRLRLVPGEPWQLRLARSRGESSATKLALSWEGAALSIVDECGPCSTPPRPPARSNDPSALPADPLCTLLAAGAGELAPGTSLRIFLWGREPGSGARLTGLFPTSIALAPQNLARRDLDSALARLPAPKQAAPKSAAEGSRH